MQAAPVTAASAPRRRSIWFVTRELDDARADCAQLIARGVDARPLPCVATRTLPWPWGESPAETWTIFTSRRSVASWVAGGAPRLGKVAALAPATSNLLRAHGVHIDLEGTEGAAALARALANEPGTALRYPTSNAGLEAAEQHEALSALTHFEVDRRLAYEVTTPPELASTQLPDDFSLAFFSPSAVQRYLSTQHREPREVVCFGTSTAAAWDAHRPSTWPLAIITRDLHATLLEENSP